MSAQLCSSSSCTLRSVFHSVPCRGQSSMKTTSALAPARSASSMRLRKSSSSVSVKVDVLVIQSKVVDAALGRRDPGGHLAGLYHLVHERMHEGVVALGGNPVLEAPLVVLARDHLAVGVDRHAGPRPDRAAEARRGESQAERITRALDHAVPALESDLAIPEVGLAHHLVQRVEHGDFLLALGS